MVLFLYTVTLAVKNGIFGQGTRPVRVDNVRCAGFEFTLLRCSHRIGYATCSRCCDASVVCPPGTNIVLISELLSHVQ